MENNERNEFSSTDSPEYGWAYGQPLQPLTPIEGESPPITAPEPPEAEKPQKPDRRFSREIYDWLEAVVYAFVTIFILFTFIFRIVGVDGRSMVPTLKDKDWLVISHLNFEPHYRDIVVITQPNSLNEPLIKRVIAVGGDEVNIDFQKHTVTVNGKVLDEPYIQEPTQRSADVTFPLTVPEGKVFVMGDNRNDSLDSRSTIVGMIDERYLMGKVLFRIYPFKHWTVN